MKGGVGAFVLFVASGTLAPLANAIPSAVVAPAEQLDKIARALSASNDPSEFAAQWQRFEGSFAREPFTKEMCWTPKDEGIYVGWTNVLTQYWFGPLSKERVSDYLDHARQLRARLRAVFPEGNYDYAGANIYYAKSTDCIPLGLFSSDVLMGSSSGIKQANMARAAQEEKHAQSCVAASDAGADPKCSAEALIAKLESARVDLMTNGSQTPEALAKGGVDAALSAAANAPKGSGSSSAGESKGTEGGDKDGSGKEKKNNGLGFLPGDAPEWVQRMARAALKALDAEYLEAVAIVLYMIAPDMVEQAAGFFSGISNNLVPENLSKALDKASEFMEMANSAASMADMIAKSGSLYKTLEKANELIEKLPPAMRDKLKSGDLGKLMGQLDSARKMLDDENVKLLLDGKLTPAKIRELAEKKAKETMEEALTRSMSASLSPEIADLYKKSGGTFGPDLKKAVVQEVKKRALDSVAPWAGDAMKRIDAAASASDVGEVLRQVGYEREIASALKIDEKSVGTLNKVRTAIEGGDYRAAWQQVVPVKYDGGDQGYQKAIVLLFDGKSAAAADQVLRAKAREVGINPASASFVLDKSLARSALAEEVATRTGVTLFAFRQIRSEHASAAQVARVQELLRNGAYANYADKLADPKGRAKVIDQLQQQVEAEFVAKLSGNDPAVKTLDGFRRRRSEIANRQLAAFSQKITGDALSEGEVDLLMRGKVQEASRQSLLRQAKKSNSEIIQSALEGNGARAGALAEAQAKGNLESAMDGKLSRDQIEAMMQADRGKFEASSVARIAQSVGFVSQSAIESVERGDLSDAIRTDARSAAAKGGTDEQLARLRKSMQRLDQMIGGLQTEAPR